eukprot:TRINITY_DN23_c0_g2_i1.p1 TRINITY_DN23_c0_g2~~TRINITY_DN23_c0_g2_i1.p1  ORF type:complete len:472 (+),score=233.25 TRINITY_DN23_c0_g2_i1:50-1465(+)
MNSKIVFCLVLLFVGTFCYETEDGVIVLTEDNFDEVVNSLDNVLVEFYAPWCGHCKKLAPEYANAAQNSDFNLAKVDATENGSLGQRFGVRGYPTLKFFEGDADSPREYTGGRSESTIISWLTKNTINELPALSSQEEIDEFNANNERAVILYGENGDEALTVARGTDYFAIAQVSDSGLAGDNAGKIVLTVDYTDEVFSTGADSSAEDLEAFLNENGFDTVVEFEREQYTRLMSTHDWLIIVVVDYTDADAKEGVISMLKESVDDNPKFAFTYGDKATWGNTASQLGSSGNFFPTAIAVGTPEGESQPQQVVFNEEQEFNADNFRAWLPTLIDGTYSVFEKSEPIPENNDGPVTVLVAKNYRDYVNEDNIVFIKYYAPWCGHCKKLIPVWDELGEHFQDRDNVVIAKLDATANAVDRKFGVTGFPTLIINKPDGSFERYEGDRSLEDLISFVNGHAGIEDVHVDQKQDEL